ncbi:MAG: VWA domain-containing protein [Dehalococcoidia bacterium]|nr:VWA domain-containing protein [Dehalococcoidia bacterium]
MQYIYSRWDGTQKFGPLNPDEVMKHITKDMLNGSDLDSVLRRFLQRGAEFQGRRLQGLQDLRERLNSARSQFLQKYNLSSVLDEVKERLDHIIDTERQAIRQRLKEKDGEAGRGENRDSSELETNSAGKADGGKSISPPQAQKPGQNLSKPMLRQLFQNMARKHLEKLDGLPSDVGGRIKQLRDYDFMDPEARQQFEELLKMLQQQVLQSHFKGLMQGIESITPETLRQIQQMVRDLNKLMEQRLKGEEPDFRKFMDQWGQFFPRDIENLDQLADHIQRQMAQMESLLKSMTPQMRQQLANMIDSLLQDNRLKWDLFQLSANLERLLPRQGAEPFSFAGEEPITLREALDLMGDMNDMDGLDRQIIQAMRSNNASDLDSDEIGRLLGDEARQITQELQQLTKMLEEAGIIRQKGQAWELTPRAVRKIGERALQDIFGKLKSSAFGDHNLEHSGIGNELLDETKPYTYDDPFLIDSQKSVMNAVVRRGRGTPVHIEKEDFEVYRTMSITRCSTVIMLDMSYSMMMTGYFQAGRKVALALDTLIRSKYPRDNLYVVAFSYFVLTLKPEMLLESHWVEYGGGTNFQEALRQARLILAKQRMGTKQIILISDGQPTTYSDWLGLDFGENDYHHSDGMFKETLREVVRCTRENITINTFMMERDRHLSEFVRLMTKINRGRVLFTNANRLGEYILVDYVKNKNKFIR